MKKILLILLFFMVLFILACKPKCSYGSDCYCYKDKECQALWSDKTCQWDCFSDESDPRPWVYDSPSEKFTSNPSETDCLILPDEELTKPKCSCGRETCGNMVWQGCQIHYSTETWRNRCGIYRHGIDFNIDGVETHLTPEEFIPIDIYSCAAFFTFEESSFYYYQWDWRKCGTASSPGTFGEEIFNCTGNLCDKIETI